MTTIEFGHILIPDLCRSLLSGNFWLSSVLLKIRQMAGNVRIYFICFNLQSFQNG